MELEENIGEEGGHHGFIGKAKTPTKGGSLVELVGDGWKSSGEPVGYRAKNQVELAEKENEPYVVPTTGPFYMHDDRFQGKWLGSHRLCLCPFFW